MSDETNPTDLHQIGTVEDRVGLSQRTIRHYDEIGLLNDPDWAGEPGHAEDNRWVHRPRMPWGSPPVSEGIATGLASLVGARRELPELHAATPKPCVSQRNVRTSAARSWNVSSTKLEP